MLKRTMALYLRMAVDSMNWHCSDCIFFLIAHAQPTRCLKKFDPKICSEKLDL
jgi:hypothetical protein